MHETNQCLKPAMKKKRIVLVHFFVFSTVDSKVHVRRRASNDPAKRHVHTLHT